MLSSKESVHTLLSLTSESVSGTKIDSDVSAYTYSVTYMLKIQFIR